MDVPGATPSALVVAFGKDGNGYLLDRNYFGGISDPVASSHLSDISITQAAATYRTNQGTYVALRASRGSMLSAFRITATNPPAIVSGWSVTRNGCGSPFVTSTDGRTNTIVWVVGTQGDQRLHGYDGDTGAVVYAGGGANELMAGTHSYPTTGIAARGRIYVATDNKVYAFIVPGVTPTPGSFAAVILATEPANLKGYWKCDETSGTTLADSSGNSKNLTITGAINANYWLGETGEQGTCFRTDGVAGYASRNDAVIPSLDNTNFTLFALFKGGTDFGVAAALAISNSSTTNDRAQIGEFSTTSQAIALARGHSAVMASGFSGGTAFDGSWHSVAFRRNGTAFNLFVDGTRVASTTATLATGSTCNRTTLMHHLYSGTSAYAKGSIQHAAIWNTALSDSEIMAIQTARFAAVILATEPANLKGYWKCDETSGTTLADSSGNSKNLTITGAINANYWLGETGEQGTCFRTDGVAGYASRNDAVIPSLDNTNFTLFALFKGGTDFGVRGALAISNSSTTNDRAQIGQNKPTSQAIAQARGHSAVMASGFSGGTAFDGSWHSVAFRRNGTAFNLFVDGTRVASTTATLATGSTCNRTTLMHHLYSGTSGYAKGSIQHAAIWNRALSDSEIMAIQTARTINPTPTPTP